MAVRMRIVLSPGGTHNNPEACAAREMFATTHWSVVLLAHEQAAKRGGRNAVISLDEAAGESRFGLEVADHVTPETLYDRSWALTLLDQAQTVMTPAEVDEEIRQLFAVFA